MTESRTKLPEHTLLQQVRRIRWQTGVSDTTARTIAGLHFGEGR